VNKRRFALIVGFILFLFSCCAGRYKLELPSEQAIQGSFQLINIYVDSAFTVDEEASIHQALLAWRTSSSNFIRFNFHRQMKPGRLEDYFWFKQFKNSIFVWRADNESISPAFDQKYAGFAGFWDLHGNIILFTDRIDKDAGEFYNVALHESGHMLGLKHISYENSVMQPRASDISSCITIDDSYRLCSIYGCIPKPECE